MPTFKGFNTIHQQKKFGIVDFELIKRDLLNAFLTMQGEVPGRPDLGTNIWSYIFEANVEEVRDEIGDEVRRIIAGDPRLVLSGLDVSYSHNTVIIDTAVTISPNTAPQTLRLVFDESSQTLNIS